MDNVQTPEVRSLLELRANILNYLQESDPILRKRRGLDPPEGVARAQFTCCFGKFCLNVRNKFNGFELFQSMTGYYAPKFELSKSNRVDLANWLKRKKSPNTSENFLLRIKGDPSLRMFACFSHFEKDKHLVRIDEVMAGYFENQSPLNPIKLVFGGLTFKNRGSNALFLANVEAVWSSGTRTGLANQPTGPIANLTNFVAQHNFPRLPEDPAMRPIAPATDLSTLQ